MLVSDLGTLGGGNTYAVAINSNGQILGNSLGTDNSSHPFVWEAGIMHDLGLLPGVGQRQCYAAAINDLGWAIGRCDFLDGSFLQSQPFIWTKDEGMRRLTLPPNADPRGINNRGDIVGAIQGLIG